ncbi:MAG TPA: FAD/NAD(P)-binding protein, partial [Patescibacteria group bacterium]|nr:FAD/NAD(P)-binding protein [Patescibacteria group bacterium]
MTQETNALQNTDRIAVIGGGPSALFILKEFVERNNPTATLDIFETKGTFGTGMPYSEEGADPEHITNLSCEEIPDVVESVVGWLRRQPHEVLAPYDIDPGNVNEQAALPRLLFGQYLEDQFSQLTRIAQERGLTVNLHPYTRVADVQDLPDHGGVKVQYGDVEEVFDKLIIAIGHAWPKRHENEIEGYFDSPYPPKKLKDVFNHHVGLRGSSLTAIDAIKTLARTHGRFERDEGGELSYLPNEGTEDFKVVMHSRRGLLPCIRFHFDHPRVTRDLFVSDEALAQHRAENDGFVSLDFMFDKVFREPMQEKDPAFYELIKDMSLEQFIEHVFAMRTSGNPFEFFADELGVSRISLERKEPIHWKEMVNFLSAAASASAKHMSAEDI